ncbi:MAG: DUF1326 domain-containing protein, partial [Vicinamibacterales bacterium]
KCSIPCPCYFAQPPTHGDCEGVLAWHIREGTFGDVRLDGLNVLALGAFEGNIWAGAKATMGIFIDERANARQREALQMIFGGQAGGWPGQFASNIAEVRGIEFAPIEFEVAKDLAFWRAEIRGKVSASAQALTGPTLRPRERVQVHNPPGAEVGPGTIATQGKATVDWAEAFGFKWDWSGRSSKHMPFDWSGPGPA